jgi:hypothetical protein
VGKIKNCCVCQKSTLREALKQNICEAIYNIQKRELQQVSRNLFKKMQARLTAEGRNFEHLL